MTTTSTRSLSPRPTTAFPPLTDSETIRLTVEPGEGEVPTAPENLKVRITGPRVVLTWGGSETENEFTVYRRQDGDNDFREIDETEEHLYYDRLKRCVASADVGVKIMPTLPGSYIRLSLPTRVENKAVY